jgi:hypothetical protein
MTRLADYELDQLLQDAQAIDRRLPPFWDKSHYTPIAPRITRLLAEQRELREQAAEREHMAAIENGG